MSQSGAFIEQRRRSLKRFLVLIVRHPILNKDEITTYFFTATSGQVCVCVCERVCVCYIAVSSSPKEVGSRMKDKFRDNKDEYWFNESAKRAEELLSVEARVKYDRVKEQVTAMHTIIASMLQVRLCLFVCLCECVWKCVCVLCR